VLKSHLTWNEHWLNHTSQVDLAHFHSSFDSTNEHVSYARSRYAFHSTREIRGLAYLSSLLELEFTEQWRSTRRCALRHVSWLTALYRCVVFTVLNTSAFCVNWINVTCLVRLILGCCSALHWPWVLLAVVVNPAVFVSPLFVLCA